jgi:hypothetical protein
MTEKERYNQAAKDCALMGKKNSKPRYDEFGICTNIVYIKMDGIRSLLSKWTDFSGDVNYPVRHPTINDPKEGYWSKSNKWTGEYGNRRRKLARFLAKEFRKLAKATK